MPDVVCGKHGTFEYARPECPRCRIDQDPALLAKLEQDAAEERIARDARDAELKKQVTVLNERLGGLHRMGKPGEFYEEHLLLGAVDLCGRRYARLKRSSRVFGAADQIVCVPWIDVFADLLEQSVTVRWLNADVVYEVSDDDGKLTSEPN